MASITYNQNQHLTWYRLDCHKYAVLNKTPGQETINILVTYGSYTFTQDVDYGETVDFTLPSDGVFDFTATLLNGSDTVPTVYEGLLADFCDLTLCYLKMLQQLYCNNCGESDSPCQDLCKERGLFGPASGNVDKERLRNGLRQLQAMFFAYISQVFEYNIGYTDLDVAPEDRAAKVAQVKKMWAQILKFSESCGFDCTKGASGQSTPCKNC